MTEIKEIVVVAVPNVKVRIQWITPEGIVVHETVHWRPEVINPKQGMFNVHMEIVK